MLCPVELRARNRCRLLKAPIDRSKINYLQALFKEETMQRLRNLTIRNKHASSCQQKTPGSNIQSIFASAGDKPMFPIGRLFSQFAQHARHDFLVFQNSQIQLDDLNFISFLKYLFYFRLQTLKEQPCTFAISLKDSVATYVDPKPVSQFGGKRFGNTEGNAEGQ